MPTVHFLNVCDGDCSIIQHGSGRVSVIDICNGKSSIQRTVDESLRSLGIGQFAAKTATPHGNYGMCDHPTDPVAYLQNLGIKDVFRFILTHPDMDHLDGFEALCGDIGVQNFWDSGVRKEKPNFESGRYREGDWDHYVEVRDRKTDVNVVMPRSGKQLRYANQGDPHDHGDCLHIVAPNGELVNAGNQSDDPNDASYVIVYRSAGGRIVFPGDAHDKTWEYVLDNYKALVRNCAVLIAPHHGRSSGRCYDFLDVLNPALTLFGCADSECLAYAAWNNRRLLHITNNQAGNIVLNAVSQGIEVYVENQEFASKFNALNVQQILHDCYYIGRITELQTEST